MPIALAPYDPSRNFICGASFRAGGKIWSRGQSFDKTVVNGRVLEQLYDQRRLVYADAEPKLARGPKRIASLLKQFIRTTVAAHAAVLSRNSDGASGTAREAPGAEESASASSGSASAPQGEAAEQTASPTDSTADAEASPALPNEDEAAAAPLGEDATAAATVSERDGQIERLMIDHSQTQLLEKAAGIAGMSSKTPKAKIAAALVDAGLAG